MNIVHLYNTIRNWLVWHLYYKYSKGYKALLEETSRRAYAKRKELIGR